MASEKIKILFICLGNICRSPAAHLIFQKKSIEKFGQNKFMVDSAGTSKNHQGEFTDHRMQKALKQNGYAEKKIARGLRLEDIDDFDFLICMDDSNKKNTAEFFIKNIPQLDQQVLKKILLMKDFDPNQSLLQIADPYYGAERDFQLTITNLEKCIDYFLDGLNS
jgi:protein-tyrosine phosphatase